MKTTELEKGIISAVVKASDLLDCFTAEEPILTLAQISSRIGLPKSSVLNLLRTLEHCGLVDKNEETKTYCLGYKTLTFRYAKLQAMPIVQHALPFMEDIQQSTGKIVYFIANFNGQALYLDAVYPGRRMTKYSVCGRVLPLHCTSAGKAILAYLPQEEVDAILDRWGMEPRTPQTITSREAMYEELRRIREQGYAVDNEEETPGVRCIGVPIRNLDGYPTGAISISGTVLSITDAILPQYAELLSHACTALSPMANQLRNGS